MADDSVLLIDPWTLRCLWSTAKYQQRLDLHEFEVRVVYRKLSSKRPGEQHCMVFARKEDEDVFFAHQFVDDRTKQPTSPLDPKLVSFKGSVYGKNDSMPNPYENRRVMGWIYAAWRRSTCGLLKYPRFWAVTSVCFPRAHNSLEAIRKACHRLVWIIGGYVYRA